MILNFATAYALRSKEERKASETPSPDPDTRNDREPKEEERYIVCRQCGQRLTRPNERTTVNGSHTHTFANPTGLVFEIGCFSMARGCSLIGPPSLEFPWFAGYSWQIAICSACQTHLGWLFLGQHSNQFFGFILDRLQEVDGAE